MEMKGNKHLSLEERSKISVLQSSGESIRSMEEMQVQQNKPKMPDDYQMYSLMPDVKISSQTEEKPDIQYDFSSRAYLDIQARDFLLNHFIETHYGTQDTLD